MFFVWRGRQQYRSRRKLTPYIHGYSGTSFVRPGLERLRDLAYAGGIDRLYVLNPDRLARKYAYQEVLLDEFRRAGIEVIFLNHRGGNTPEDELLLQVQGMMAEYERAKILERTRRGKRHAANQGEVSVLSRAPYGYRYITKQEGGGQARRWRTDFTALVYLIGNPLEEI